MLTPLHHRASLTLTSSVKLTTADERRHFLDPDFFKPLAIKSGLSCTYPPEFYEAFSQSSSSSHHSEIAMLVLEYMTLQDKARLPLFHGASERYVKQVLPAIQEKLTTEDNDAETLATKIHIINCGSQLGYLTRTPRIFQGIYMLCRVNLIGMDLQDAYLHMARFDRSDLRAANLRGADISWASFNWADLRAANLCGADLSWASLVGANLSRANLNGADLVGVDLTGANLTEADLSVANLSKAHLSGANLSGANLSGAIGYIPKT